MSLAVVGTGLSRTGTTTLRRVIEDLGFGTCYNSSELFTHPRGIEFWEGIENGEKVDFEEFFDNYGAIIGFPGYIFHRELVKKYPDAKVILSYRDPEEWYEDIRGTVFQPASSHVNKSYSEEVRKFDDYLAGCITRIHSMQARILEDGYFEGRFDDKEYSIKRYVQWNEEIKAAYPPDRLLVYQVTEGWKPVCDFLEVPVPEDKPFPHLNSPDVFHKRSTSGFLQKLKESEGLD